MSVLENNLPFARGDTFGGIGGASGMTLANVSLDHLIGATFEVPDSVHGTGASVLLRLVKNDSGSAITFSNQLMRFGVDSKDFGAKVDGTTNQIGMIGLPIDDAFASGASIPANDYFYLVQRGPCTVKTNASSFACIAGEPVTPDSAGALWGTVPDAYKFQLGTADIDYSTAAGTVLVWCEGNLWNPSGSGT